MKKRKGRAFICDIVELAILYIIDFMLSYTVAVENKHTVYIYIYIYIYIYDEFHHGSPRRGTPISSNLFLMGKNVVSIKES